MCSCHPEAHLLCVLLALGLDGCRLPHDVVDLPHDGLLKMLRRFGLTQLQAGLLSLKQKLQVLLHFLQLKLVVHYVHILGTGRPRRALVLTRSQMLGWRERWAWLLLGRRRRLLLKVAELQLLVVAQLQLDRRRLKGGRGVGSLLNILRGDDAHGLGSQLLPQPLGCALLFRRGLGFQPGLK